VSRPGNPRTDAGFLFLSDAACPRRTPPDGADVTIL